MLTLDFNLLQSVLSYNNNMKTNKLIFLSLLVVLGCIFKQIRTEVVQQPRALTTGLNISALTPVEQQILSLFGGTGVDQALLLQSMQSSGLLQVFSQIPQQIIEQFLKQLQSGFIDPIPPNYNPSTNFSNWGETVNMNLDGILYPTEYSAYSGLQVSYIQEFVKLGALEGKRIRGSGSRHSWSKIFSDANQLLVSFYPFQITDATSQTMDNYTYQITQLQQQLAALDIEHLNQIRKVGDINTTIKQNNQTKIVQKHLVKIGASVSNNQLRLWSIKNGYQYKTNTIIVEVSFCGALSTCSHGSGINTQPLPDYVHEIQFIDHKGNRQIISKECDPGLIKSAASSLGLLGLVVFVTIEMEDLQIVKTMPRNTYKDFVIPWPKDYPNKKARLQRPQWKQFVETALPTTADQNWANNFNKFKQAISQTYCEWFYYPLEGVHVYESVWSAYALKTPENIAKIFANQEVFIEDYPPPALVTLSQFAQFLADFFADDIKTQSLVNVLMKNPSVFLPPNNIYINYPDAVHFLRGVQNFKVRDFQVEINIPAIKKNGKMEPDYDLIQKIWWAGLEIAESNSEIINLTLQMRLFRGSDATLAPEMGYDYTCSIEIVRSVNLNQAQQDQWKKIIVKAFNAWKNITDKKGKKVTIRPHWGKEWSAIPEVKSHLLSDDALKKNIKKFLKDYESIAKLKGFDYLQNLKTFSNQVYRELLNNAIGSKGTKIN